MSIEELIDKFADKGYLINPSVLKTYRRELLMNLLEILPKNVKKVEVLSKEKVEEYLNKYRKIKGCGFVDIVFSYDPKKYIINPEPKGWFTLFLNRFLKLYDILRKKVGNTTTISSLRFKTSGFVSIIGMVYDIVRFEDGSGYILLEDTTGLIKVIFRKNMIDVFRKITYDEVICVRGNIIKKNTIIAEEVIFPEFPQQTPKYFKEDTFVLFVGDIHVGSRQFLSRSFKRLINFLNMKIDDKKLIELSEKVKYVIILGDLVDGVGVYPEQEKELEIKDIYKQYETLSDFFKSVERDDITFIFIPGNHDGLRLSEPQPPFTKEYEKYLLESNTNVIVLSNPSVISLYSDKEEKENAVKVLLYHGYSVDWYVNNVPYLSEFKYEKPRIYQEWLLSKRHLSPSHGAIPIAPLNEDLLVIDDNKVPNIFATAHVHRFDFNISKNIVFVSTGCFQGKTTFQEKIGHEPTPGYAIAVNLKNYKGILFNLIPRISKKLKI